jgi:hypothetical protein
MVANLYSMQGKPVPEMPATPEWNVVSFVRTISITIFGITICIHLIASKFLQLNPSQGSNNVPVVPPQVGGVGEANQVTPSDVDISTPISKTV